MGEAKPPLIPEIPLGNGYGLGPLEMVCQLLKLLLFLGSSLAFVDHGE